MQQIVPRVGRNNRC